MNSLKTTTRSHRRMTNRSVQRLTFALRTQRERAKGVSPGERHIRSVTVKGRIERIDRTQQGGQDEGEFVPPVHRIPSLRHVSDLRVAQVDRGPCVACQFTRDDLDLVSPPAKPEGLLAEHPLCSANHAGGRDFAAQKDLHAILEPSGPETVEPSILCCWSHSSRTKSA
jgi:hypothetical protein